VSVEHTMACVVDQQDVLRQFGRASQPSHETSRGVRAVDYCTVSWDEHAGLGIGQSRLEGREIIANRW
jgi:hypothetical protein